MARALAASVHHATHVSPARTPRSVQGADEVDRELFDGPGYLVLRNLVDAATVDAALRVLNLEIMRRGLTPEEISECAHATFFPHLRWEPEILALRQPVADLLQPRPDEQWADAQLLLRFPDEVTSWPLTSHVDELPHWAGDRTYRAIAGVALSPSKRADGCLAVWPRSQQGVKSEPSLLELDPGDVVVMHPGLHHSSTLNTGGRVRYAAYFRLLTAPSP